MTFRLAPVALCAWDRFPHSRRAHSVSFSCPHGDLRSAQLQGMIDGPAQEIGPALRQRGALREAAGQLQLGPACAAKFDGVTTIDRSNSGNAGRRSLQFVHLFLNRAYGADAADRSTLSTLRSNLVKGDNLAAQRKARILYDQLCCIAAAGISASGAPKPDPRPTTISTSCSRSARRWRFPEQPLARTWRHHSSSR